MTARALTWFEDDDPRDLFRWAVAAAVVVCLHVALIGGYLLWQPQSDDDMGDEASIIAIQLTPQENEQVEQAKVDAPQPPQDTTPEVTLPEEKPPEKVQPTNPSERTTARVEAAAPNIDPSWSAFMVKQLQRFKSYPSGARARNEEGIAVLAFTLDRSGHVVSWQVVTSSGYPDLDAEVGTMVARAQPLPAFPASMPQAQQDFSVKIHFTLR
ncbi:MAG: TonB family protein [Xanthobacteraceae bacterium]